MAHDSPIPRPIGLSEYQDTGQFVTVNKRPLTLYVHRLKPGVDLRITGNADQTVPVGKAPNIGLFSKAVSPK